MEKITLGYLSHGNHWGGKVWLVNDLQRKREGKPHYCVMGLSHSGWWHIFYGTLKECRDYIRYEEDRITFDEFKKRVPRLF